MKWKALCPDPFAKGRQEFAFKAERVVDSFDTVLSLCRLRSDFTEF